MATKTTKKEPSFIENINSLCQEKSLDREAVMGIIKESLATAYRKMIGLGPEYESRIHVELANDRSGDLWIRLEKDVVDTIPKEGEGILPPQLYVTLEEARKYNPSCKVGDKVQIQEKPVSLSRIATNQARQMIFQKIREMERDKLYNEFKQKEGELTHGYFQRWKNDTMLIDLGKIEGIMPKREQIPGEKYKKGDRLKAIIQKVELKNKEPLPIITLSRASSDFVKKLFEMEVPEIYDKVVQILDIARIPSVRTKVVVTSTRSDVDPIAACVGNKGVLIQSIIRELGNERIDIVEYSDDPAQFITNAISPAKPIEVHADRKRGDALVIVPEDALSLAIGINGSNVKLASQLSGYKIDIKTVSQYNQELASPEARKKLDRLFNAQAAADAGEEEEEVEEGTPLSEIPGLTQRVIELLEAGGIHDVETLVDYTPERLASIPGIGPTTAEQILKLIQESVEWVEE